MKAKVKAAPAVAPVRADEFFAAMGKPSYCGICRLQETHPREYELIEDAIVRCHVGPQRLARYARDVLGIDRKATQYNHHVYDCVRRKK